METNSNPGPSVSADLATVKDIHLGYLATIDSAAGRRQAANLFFLIINTVLLAMVGYMSQLANGEPQAAAVANLITAFSGIIICYVWNRTLQNHHDLKAAKMAVIAELEALLPFAPMTKQSAAMSVVTSERRFTPLAEVEIKVPWVFMALYSPLVALHLVQFLRA